MATIAAAPSHQIVEHRVRVGRISNVDIVRGLVMVIMALDHVRALWSAAPYAPEDVSETTIPLFFTRWITHFCAPVFVFLSGVSVFLYAQKKSRKDVSIFLLTRGLWLVVVEVVVISFFLQFAYQVILLQVIWVIGWSMVLLAAFIWIPRNYLAVLAITMIGLHNLLPDIQPATFSEYMLGMLHHTPFVIQKEGWPLVIVAYTVIPWAAVMMAGYACGSWFILPAGRQNARLIIVGILLLSLFAILRGVNGYGDPTPWSIQPAGETFTILSFLNVTKYPPSLLFLCLTLGGAFLLLAVSNHFNNKVTGILQVYGRVPFFYYVLHFPLIVAGAYAWMHLSFGEVVNLAFMPADVWPEGYQPSLLRTYLVWIVLVVALYFPCRWYARYKQDRRHWWLSYL